LRRGDSWTVWRICKSQYEDSAFEGVGAKKVGGRWNSRGIRVVYTSESLALAALELLVHVHADEVPDDLIAIPAEVPDAMIYRPLDSPDQELPADWRSVTGCRELVERGDRWQKSGDSAAMLVPSVVIPEEANLVLNPDHPDFAAVEIGEARPFSFDPRLFA
jgi:RES domain-containing protein